MGEANSDVFPEDCNAGLQLPLVPRYHQSPMIDPSPFPEQLEADTNIECHSTLDMCCEKACLAEATNSAHLSASDQSCQESHKQLTSDFKPEMVTEFRGGSIPTSAADAARASRSDKEDPPFESRGLGGATAGQHERLPKQKQAGTHSTRQDLAKILTQKKSSWPSNASTLGKSGSVAESTCSLPSRRSHTTSSPSHPIDSGKSMHDSGQCTPSKVSSMRKMRFQACCQDLDDLDERLRLRYEKLLKKFKSNGSEVDAGEDSRGKAK